MTTAFQTNAFQDDAFQIDGGQVVVITPQPRGGGRAKAWWKRRSGIYWPKKISKKVIKEIVEEAVDELPLDVKAEVDIGLLAERVMDFYTPALLRALNDREAFIAMLVREMEEQDDEDVILWLLAND